jgi:hypothetical protein
VNGRDASRHTRGAARRSPHRPLVANPVNGTVIILFVWLLDVVFGPAFRPADTMVSRLFPTHYLSLWMMDEPSGHSGRPGDLGWALTWTAIAVALSWAAVAATSRTARTHTRTRPGSAVGQLAVGTRMGLREVGRNHVLWALLVAVPGLFVALSAFTTPDGYETMMVREAGRDVAATLWFPDTHPGLMAPISVGALAAVVGLFTALGARNADRRLALAGFRPMSLLTSRFAVMGVLAVVVTAASLAVTAALFEPRQWGPYILASLLLAPHLRASRRARRVALRTRRRGARRVPHPVPRPRHRAEPHAQPRALYAGAPPARLRREPSALRRSPHQHLRRDHRPGHCRRLAGCAHHPRHRAAAPTRPDAAHFAVPDSPASSSRLRLKTTSAGTSPRALGFDDLEASPGRQGQCLGGTKPCANRPRELLDRA